MPRKFEITYTALSGYKRKKIYVANSKYDAKQKFYRDFPKYDIVSVKEVRDA